jgi:hypothetical protein
MSERRRDLETSFNGLDEHGRFLFAVPVDAVRHLAERGINSSPGHTLQQIAQHALTLQEWVSHARQKLGVIGHRSIDQMMLGELYDMAVGDEP